MSTLDPLEEALYAILVTITGTDGSRYQFCSGNKEIEGFIREPGLLVELPDNTMTMQSEGAMVKVPRYEGIGLMEPFSRLMKGRAAPKYTVSIEEADAENVEESRERLYLGVVEGVSNLGVHTFDIPVANIKQQIGSNRIGIPALRHCPWALGHPQTCKVNVADFTHTVTTAAEDPNGQLTDLLLSAPPPGRPEPFLAADLARVYAEGVIGAGGIEVSIRSVDGPILRLREAPPEEWLVAGVELSLVEGCNGTLNNCITQFNNVNNFGGIGIFMSERNPERQRP